MNLSQIKVLVAIADTGSLTFAAERLSLSQSGVSQAIAALEEDLGVQLFTRGRRGAVATAVGEEVVREARAVLAGLDAIRRKADAAAGIEQGKLRLAAFPSVFSTLLPPLLRRFRDLHPGIEVVALEASDAEIETWLANGTVDLGVTTAESFEATDWPLGQDDWVAVLPSSHPIALSPSRAVALTRLADEPFVLATGGCTIHAGSLAERLGAPLEQIKIEVRDWVSAFALVREGLGVTVVPEPTLPADRRGLRVLPLKEGLHRYFGLRCSKTALNTPAVTSFLGLAKAASSAKAA
ncbi:LysR family transcriptional regulator (plasmid) [Sulfitobacter alexandrii]|uniref:LysR family transcriptional regulator n=1 Tax=Sulfitobacter alexandrii TaxID=1917485 RepID=A0A1J0WNP5_9RHOB|nr:LysR family transcriptional regulator [Sulfitobacter alexandrii]APE45806.1 LysR family transcriptional regulator [Sulfitobacter alexandrii]